MTTAPDSSLRTTAIGSLPHHNIDAALEFSFQFGIPFLPQIPIRNAWEYMIPQALEGLPGLRIEEDGSASLSLPIWEQRAREFGEKLDRALRDPGHLSDFEPSPSVSSLWHPFLWELSEREVPMAKVQIAGPITSQWALKVKSETGEILSADRITELSTQIYRLGLVRGLAMVRRLKTQGVSPILFLDEPALFALNLNNPRHRIAFEELKLGIASLRKEGAQVGLHCCSNTDWKALLSLPLDILSLDAGLSLSSLVMEAGAELSRFVAEGGRLALGIIPTARSSVLQSLRARDLVTTAKATLSPCGEHDSRKILSECLLTPACGLAYHSVGDAEVVASLVAEVAEALTEV